MTGWQVRAGIFIAAALVPAASPLAKSKPAKADDLKIVSVDVEGGAAVLFRTPEGKSMLIDTGWKPRPPRPGTVPTGAAPAPTSAETIAKAAASLGIKKIDYLVMTHYHVDHVGGIAILLQKLPVDTFIDHGPNREVDLPGAPPDPSSPQLYYPDWVAAYQGHNHLSVKVGQTLDVGSMHIQFVTSDGEMPPEALPGAGQANPACAGVPRMTKDGGDENNRSLGMLITFGKTRIVYLGDLAWNKEVELLCPINKIGKADVYFVTNHGMNISSSPPTAAIDPLVAVMQNGRTKGGDQEVTKLVESFPSLQGFWRTHYAVRHPELNGDPNYIANLDWVPDQSFPIALDISRNGAIKLTNGRNNFSKTYQARGAAKQN